MSKNFGKKIANIFKSKKKCTSPISRLQIRAFIFECIIDHGNIYDLSTKCINIVMNHFDLDKSERNKIKSMISRIIKRDARLPPIITEDSPLANQHFKKKPQSKPILSIDSIQYPAIEYKNFNN